MKIVTEDTGAATVKLVKERFVPIPPADIDHPLVCSVHRTPFRYTVRHFATIIENRCPVTVKVPESCLKNVKAFDKKLIERAYEWEKRLSQYKDDMYVRCVVNEMENHFKSKHNIAEINEEWIGEYERFTFKLCEAIVRAIDFGNKFVAHCEFDGTRVYALNKFRPIDEYLTIFYNAMVGNIDS
ncbi:hypothetical protein V9T40_001335 [Parthenolecanium corni]|uniref:Uncharacterized protein n=1 Tax=Parthenolecanium corni TaxID=536013 RepID=A0AAN9Y197_9HEMI